MCSERITLGTHSHRMLCQMGIRKNPRRMVPQGGSWEESWSYTAQACRALFLYYPMDKNKKKAYFTGELRVDGWALSQQPSWQQPWLGPYSLSRALGPSLAKPPDPPEKLSHAHTACWSEAMAMRWPRPKPVGHFRAWLTEPLVLCMPWNQLVCVAPGCPSAATVHLPVAVHLYCTLPTASLQGSPLQNYYFFLERLHTPHDKKSCLAVSWRVRWCRCDRVSLSQLCGCASEGDRCH